MNERNYLYLIIETLPYQNNEYKIDKFFNIKYYKKNNGIKRY